LFGKDGTQGGFAGAAQPDQGDSSWLGAVHAICNMIGEPAANLVQLFMRLAFQQLHDQRIIGAVALVVGEQIFSGKVQCRRETMQHSDGDIAVAFFDS
jgi:hypothetical protein